MPLTEKSQEFRPACRLHYPREYRLFFQKSEVFRLSECVIFCIPNTFGHYRVGITIKARGISLNRNKIKRAIREAFRRHGSGLGSFDYNVVIPSSKKTGYPYSQVLAKCLTRQFFKVRPKDF